MWQNPRSNLKGTFVYFLPSVPPIKSIYSPPRCCKLRCLHWFSLKSCSNVLRFAKLKGCFHWSFSYYKAVRWTLSFWKRNIIKTKRAGMTLNKRSRRLTKASPWEIRDTNNCNLLTVNSRYNATFIFGFWQGLAIKKSVKLSWPNYVYKYWSRFFIQTSHRAIWLSLHMWAYAPQPNNSDKLWRSLKLCFSRKFACCLTYPLSSVWPELSDLSSALILHGFHYYNSWMAKKGEKCAFQTQCKLENRDSRAKRMFFSTNLSSLSIYFLRDHAYFSLLSFLRRNSSNTLKSMANNAITSHHYHISPFSSKTLFASRTLMVRQRSVGHPGDWRRLPRVPIGLSAKWCWETLPSNQDNSSLAFWYFICIFFMVIILRSIKNYFNII